MDTWAVNSGPTISFFVQAPQRGDSWEGVVLNRHSLAGNSLQVSGPDVNKLNLTLYFSDVSQWNTMKANCGKLGTLTYAEFNGTAFFKTGRITRRDANGDRYAQVEFWVEQSTAPVRFDDLLYTVTIGGNDVSQYVSGGRIRLGYDIPTSEAEINFYQIPPTDTLPITQWDQVFISCGRSGGSGNVLRFGGFIIDPAADTWPWSLKLSARGPLYILDQLEPPIDPWATYQNPISTPNPFATASMYNPPGYDMSLNAQGQSDDNMVLFFLGQAGIDTSTWLASTSQILGTGEILGTRAWDQFVWRRQQKARQFIEALDSACYGMRTYERLGGQIWRHFTSAFAPFDNTRVDVTGSTDILEGSNIDLIGTKILNRVEVQGWNNGGNPELNFAYGVAPILPPNVGTVSDTLQSNLVERSYDGQTDANGNLLSGLRCDSLANWWLNENLFLMFEGPIVTWRDDAFEPGKIAYINEPHLQGINQTTWIKHIEIEFNADPATFTQTLQVRASKFGQNPGVGFLGRQQQTYLGGHAGA